MTPSMLRSVLQSYLAGTCSLSDLVADLRSLGTAPSAKVQARIESLLHEAGLVLDAQPNFTPSLGSVAVARGLACELLDSLPDGDVAPDVDVVMAALTRQAPDIAQRFGIEIVGLGGSTVAASRTAFSDIDLAAKATRKVKLADIAGATEALRLALDWPVDLVMLDLAEPAFRDRFSSTLLPVMAGAA